MFMSKKFLKVCDGVNLIVKPCEYRGFNLKPGMMLFDAASSANRYFRDEDDDKYPFVACNEEMQWMIESDYGRPTNVPILKGFKLTDDGPVRDSMELNFDTYRQTKLLNAVDLALGEDRLYNLVFEDQDKRYTKDSTFSVCNPDIGFNSIYSHMIGNVFLQKTDGRSRDRAVLLTKDQVNALSDLSPYGIMEYGESYLEVEYNRGINDKGSFHDLLVAIYNNGQSYGLTKEESADIISGLKDYYSHVDTAGRDISVDGVSTMCTNFTTKDGFSVKPFMIRMTFDAAKKYIEHVYQNDYMEYEHCDANFIIDDKAHFVYLTSISGYDTNSDWDWDDYDTPWVNSHNAMFTGFYFDGYSYMQSRFAVKNVDEFDMKEHVYRSLGEVDYMRRNLSGYKDIDDLREKVNNRLHELESLLEDHESSLTNSEFDSIKQVYSNYLDSKVKQLSNTINYEVLTDNELKGVSNNEKEGDVDVDLKYTDVSSGVDL